MEIAVGDSGDIRTYTRCCRVGGLDRLVAVEIVDGNNFSIDGDTYGQQVCINRKAK